MLIWMNADAGQMGAEDGILRAADVEQLMSLEEARANLRQAADELLEQARQQAQDLMESAHAAARELVMAAQEEIRAERERGYQEGLHEAAMEWHRQQAGKALENSRSLQAMQAKLADIVTGAVERIVHTEQRSALYQRALKNVQSLTRGATSLTLRVGPDDYEQARDCIASLGESELPVEVKVDATLRPGSCIFESDLGVLDASLQTQLDGLRQAMGRAVRRAVVDDVAPTDAAAAVSHTNEEPPMGYGEGPQAD